MLNHHYEFIALMCFFLSEKPAGRHSPFFLSPHHFVRGHKAMRGISLGPGETPFLGNSKPTLPIGAWNSITIFYTGKQMEQSA